MAKAKKSSSTDTENPQTDLTAAASSDNTTFEQTLGELEDLVEAMESDQAPLGELIENYEKGTLLYEKCQRHLDDAQRRVELIRDGGNGKKLQDFDKNSESLERKSKSQANNQTDDGELF